MAIKIVYAVPAKINGVFLRFKQMSFVGVTLYLISR
jgi:hypothetical protein